MAADDVIEVKKITAADTYPDFGMSPKYLVDMDGFNPDPPTDLANTTFKRTSWDKIWHTNAGDKSNLWLLLDLGKAIPISEMYIWNLCQGGSGNREIKDITITYSADSNDGTDGTWSTLGNYEIPQSDGTGNACLAQKIINVKVTARFIRIKANSSYGDPDYWGLGKIVLLQDHSQSNDEDMQYLKEQLALAKARKFYLFTDGSWQALTTEINKAQELVDNESKDIPAIIAATDNLIDAINALEEKTNLVLSATTGTASAFYSAGYEAANALDGNFYSRWATTSGTEFWFQIEFSSPRKFNQVAIFSTPKYADRLSDVSISVSNDGQTWTLWRQKDCADYYVSAVGEMITMKYIKISFNDCNSEGINVDEIMVFEDASAIESKDFTAARPENPSWIKQEPATTPNVYQIRKADLKYGMFIHYGLNTFVGEEWTDGSYSESTYNPNLATLDPESWVKAAYEGGMNFVVLVAKHHEGFALWNTAVGTYNINNTGRDGDKRDIVKEVSDACKKYGIKLGLYYSAWDRNWDRNHTRESTGLDKVALNQLYNDFALAQVTELMDGRYGEISEFWIDGTWMKKNKDWEFSRLYNTVKSLQPTCQFAVNWTIATMPDQTQGGEEAQYFPSDFRLADPHFTRPGANADPKVYKYEGNDYYLPFEATICINNSWFWSSKQNIAGVKSADDIKKGYEHMSEQHNTLVLNLSPNPNGILNSFDVDGLYAGARALGIARGSARTNIQPNECKVEIRYVTNKGYIAYPTKYLYGNEGENYNVIPENLGAVGYKFLSGTSNTNGTFTKNKIVVELTYEDTDKIQTGFTKVNEESGSNAYVIGKKIVLACDDASDVSIYNITGTKVKEIFLYQKSREEIDVNNLQGVYIVKFSKENKVPDTKKILIQ